MIRPLANAPTPSAGPGGGIRKETPKPFRDWIATQAPASPPTMTTTTAGLHAPATGVVVSTVVPPAGPMGQEGAAATFDASAVTASMRAPWASGVLGDRLPASATFVVHLQDRAGSVELVALPWRLVATGWLAYLLAAHGSASTPEIPAIDASPAVSEAMESHSIMLPPIVGNDGACVADNATHAMPGTAILAASDALDAAGDADATPESTLGHAALPWTARLMRWVEANDGAATLWLRDYRLEESGIRRLVATLRAAAGEAGMRLDRVVINGKTLWHVHRHSRETAHAG
jgi:hypothetical protein